MYPVHHIFLVIHAFLIWVTWGPSYDGQGWPSYDGWGTLYDGQGTLYDGQGTLYDGQGTTYDEQDLLCDGFLW